jgi:hypothetical protein
LLGPTPTPVSIYGGPSNDLPRTPARVWRGSSTSART